MKDFKNSTKMQMGHSFGAHHGFTGSSGQSMEIKPYVRKTPAKKFAEGGSVGNSVVVRKDPVTEFDKDYGGKGPLRSGFKKGGALKKAMGGPVGMKSGGKSKGGKKKFGWGGSTSPPKNSTPPPSYYPPPNYGNPNGGPSNPGAPSVAPPKASPPKVSPVPINNPKKTIPKPPSRGLAAIMAARKQSGQTR